MDLRLTFSFISYQSAGIIGVCHQAQPELSSGTYPQWSKSRTHHHKSHLGYLFQLQTLPKVCKRSGWSLWRALQRDGTALLPCPPHFILEVAQEFLEHFLHQHPSLSKAQIHQNQSKRSHFIPTPIAKWMPNPYKITSNSHRRTLTTSYCNLVSLWGNWNSEQEIKILTIHNNSNKINSEIKLQGTE